MTKLYIFDDSVLNLETGEIHPHIRATIANLRSGAHVAIVSNQPGPAIRDANLPWSAEYPSLTDVEGICSNITRLGVKVYVCLAAHNPNYIDGWSRSEKRHLFPKGVPAGDLRLSLKWLLPNTGMLEEAMKDVTADAQNTVFVGGVGEPAARAARTLGIRRISTRELIENFERVDFTHAQFEALYGLVDGVQANGTAVTEFVGGAGLDGTMIVSCTGIGTFAISVHGNARKIS